MDQPDFPAAYMGEARTGADALMVRRTDRGDSMVPYTNG